MRPMPVVITVNWFQDEYDESAFEILVFIIAIMSGTAVSQQDRLRTGMCSLFCSHFSHQQVSCL